MGKTYDDNKTKMLFQMRIDILQARISLKGMGNALNSFLNDYPEFKELPEHKVKNMFTGNLSFDIEGHIPWNKKFHECFCSWCEEIVKNS